PAGTLAPTKIHPERPLLLRGQSIPLRSTILREPRSASTTDIDSHRRLMRPRLETPQPPSRAGRRNMETADATRRSAVAATGRKPHPASSRGVVRFLQRA